MPVIACAAPLPIQSLSVAERARPEALEGDARSEGEVGRAHTDVSSSGEATLGACPTVLPSPWTLSLKGRGKPHTAPQEKPVPRQGVCGKPEAQPQVSQAS